MLSRRNFYIISLVMLVVMFLFVFLSAAKDRVNDYHNNEYAAYYSELLTSDSKWSGDTAGTAVYPRKTALYLGDLSSDAFGGTVGQWGAYTKRILKSSGSLDELIGGADSAEVLLINPDHLADGDIETLRGLSENGLDMIFLKLPEISRIRENAELMRLLGIKRVMSDSCRLSGLKLFGGFLLGGSEDYIIKAGDDAGRQDMTLEVPWYMCGTGTKIYMTGTLDGDVENEELPAMIWRASTGSAMVFAVNGDFLLDISGIGIIDAFTYELNSYELYPVVNSQLMIISGGPDIASENEDAIKEIYGRTLSQTYRDIVMPSVAALADTTDFPMNCMMMLKGDISDPAMPDANDLIYYLKWLKEYDSEMGISLVRRDGLSAADAVREYNVFLLGNEMTYQFCGLFVDESQFADIPELIRTGGEYPFLAHANTVISESGGDYDLFDYVDEHTTIQRITISGYSHTFSEDFRQKCYETAFAYSGIIADMTRVSFPDEDSPHWEVLSDELSRNISTYWKPYSKFTKSTISESDRRVRQFLALDYSHMRKDRTVFLDCKKTGDRAWFILRTHGEKVKNVNGGVSVRTEDGSYLITALSERVEIELEPDSVPYYIS